MSTPVLSIEDTMRFENSRIFLTQITFPSKLTPEGMIDHIQNGYFDDLCGTGHFRLAPTDPTFISRRYTDQSYTPEGLSYIEPIWVNDKTIGTFVFCFDEPTDWTLEEEIDAMNFELSAYVRNYDVEFKMLPIKI